MRLLVLWYDELLERGDDPLIAIPLAVFDFLCIHPFANGNGRMARLRTHPHMDCGAGRDVRSPTSRASSYV